MGVDGFYRERPPKNTAGAAKRDRQKSDVRRRR